MKHLIPFVIIGLLLTVGCTRNKKAEPQPMAAPPTEYAPPPAPELIPAPEPTYTPAPEPEPIVTPAPTPAPVQTVKPAPQVKSTPAPRTTSTKVYVVKKGDTLSEIARAHKTTVQKIMALNPSIKQADKIYAGQKLKMP